MLELLTAQEMQEADRLASEAGVPSIQLMESAGAAIADEVSRRWPKAEQIAVLCGPGNNGGDGFVAARLLAARGYAVKLAMLGERDRLRGDAAIMASRYKSDILPANPEVLEGADIAIDALFGAGLSRPISGDAANIVAALNETNMPVVSADIPSGVDGTTGAVTGSAVEADVTVTFFRLKTGHLLLPGRFLCGELALAQIGIPDAALDRIGPRVWRNAPPFWLRVFPRPLPGGHKYSRGHALIVAGGAEASGAARLAARGAARIGSGLVTAAMPPDALPMFAAQPAAIMTRCFDGADGLRELLTDTRRNAVAFGPGAGVGEPTRRYVDSILESDAAATLDADALTSFANDADTRFQMIKSRNAEVVLTPHEGEFARLFRAFEGSKLDRARAAAEASGAVVLLKGADTVVAAPDGRATIADNAPPWLATAGAGDVLAGMLCGLLAQHMPAFEAVSAAAWLHGEAARVFGPGLIADDLPEALPAVLQAILQS